MGAVQRYKHRRQEDSSCHNPFRKERYRSVPFVASKLNIDLTISEQEGPDLIRLLKEFAESRAWSFRDASVEIPGEVNALNVSLCNDAWLRILVAENHWRTTSAFDHPGRGLPIELYGDVPADQWQAIARELVAALEAKWPGRVRFVDRDGRVMNDRPSFLE
jgi:hypothetical protein